jgi:hypothetical protein
LGIPLLFFLLLILFLQKNKSVGLSAAIFLPWLAVILNDSEGTHGKKDFRCYP